MLSGALILGLLVSNMPIVSAATVNSESNNSLYITDKYDSLNIQSKRRSDWVLTETQRFAIDDFYGLTMDGATSAIASKIKLGPKQIIATQIARFAISHHWTGISVEINNYWNEDYYHPKIKYEVKVYNNPNFSGEYYTFSYGGSRMYLD